MSDKAFNTVVSKTRTSDLFKILNYDFSGGELRFSGGNAVLSPQNPLLF